MSWARVVSFWSEVGSSMAARLKMPRFGYLLEGSFAGRSVGAEVVEEATD